MLKRLPYVLFSGLLLASAAFLGARALATFEIRSLKATQALLESGARHLEQDLGNRGVDLPQVAAAFAADPTLGADLKLLVNALNNTQGNRTIPPAMQARLEMLRSKLDDRIANFRAARPEIEGIAIVSESGIVILSSSSSFSIGTNLAPGHFALPPPPPPPAADDGEPTPTPRPVVRPQLPPDQLGPLDPVLDGELRRGTSAAGTIRYWGAAPIVQKGKIVGGVVVEQHLRALQETPGLEPFLVLDKKVLLGKTPEGYAATDGDAAQAAGRPLLLAARSTKSVIFLDALADQPLFTGNVRPGVWGQRFSVPGVANAYGFVTADLTPIFTELASMQLMLIALAGVLWFLHVAMLLFAGARLPRGIDKVADYLATVQQGNAGKALTERDVPSELRRLLVLLNKTVERAKDGAGLPGALPKSPTLDEVIQAQAVSSSPEIADLHFEGISNAGSIGIGGAADNTPAPPPPPADDGFESLPEVGSLEFAGDAPAQAGGASSLPELPEALQAVDQLSGDDQFGATAAFATPSPAAGPPASGARAGQPESHALDDTLFGELSPAASFGLAATPAPGTTNAAAAPAAPGIDASSDADAAPALARDPAAQFDEAGDAATAAEAEPPATPAPAKADAAPSVQISPELAAQLAAFTSDAGTGDDTPPPAPGAEDALDELNGMATPAAAMQPPPPPDPEPIARIIAGEPDLPDDSLADAAWHAAPSGAAATERPRAAAPGTPAVATTSAPAPAPSFTPAPAPAPAATSAPTPAPTPAPVKAAPATAEAAVSAPNEAHYREVYEGFVATRKSCGEIGELSYEKFKARLDETRAAVIAKHACKDVRFQVYVKNGKAALKATPSR